MLLRPFLLLARSRLILIAVLSMLAVLFTFSLTTAEHLTDFGIYWHYFCGCAPDVKDTRSVLDLWSILDLILGAILGWTMTRPSKNASGWGVMSGGSLVDDTCFLLTRPIPRSSVLLRPLAIATAALALIPALCILLLVGWLRLVHAPSLAYPVALLELVPSASRLGPHPSLFGLLAASHFLRFYVAGLSVGLCSYSMLSAQRWLALSSNAVLRFIVPLPLVAIYLIPLTLVHSEALRSAVLFIPHKDFSLDLQPSIHNIALHFAFAAVVIYGNWEMLRRTEL